jgi:arsenate reductase (glutaredoxin)
VVPIVDQPPSTKQLTDWVRRSGKPVAKWFNTSGQSYRALLASKGKVAVAALSDAEAVKLLAADGKLIKRPILITGQSVCVGFVEDEWVQAVG